MATTSWVVLGDVARDRLGTRAGIPLQGTNGGMPRPGEQDGRIGPVFGGMGQCGVAELVEGPPMDGVAEQLRCSAVGQPGAAGHGALVDSWYGPRRPAISQEHRASGALGEKPREQQCRAG